MWTRYDMKEHGDNESVNKEDWGNESRAYRGVLD